VPPLKPLLIEHWLPIEAIGAESQREHAYGTPFPAPNRLHVWRARRPLTTSRAAILAGVLPQWSEDFPEKLKEKFPNEKTYHTWVQFLFGIRGDPGKSRKLAAWARSKGIGLINSPYDHPRAFSISPDSENFKILGDLLEWTWSKRNLSILDPFSGGGSIPLESLRYGFTTYAKDLNPVAAVILKATVDYPAQFGSNLIDDIQKWGNRWYELVKPKLKPFFSPLPPNEESADYLWVRTVACPTTGKPVPLSPNWWLKTDGNFIAVKLIAENGMDTPHFEIITGAKAKASKPDVGRSPWTSETIDGDYIKAEAQAGRMGQVLYASGFLFHAAKGIDLQAVKLAEIELTRKRSEWIAKNIIPVELIPEGNKTAEPMRYGAHSWDEMFSPRQLLVVATLLETLGELHAEIRKSMDSDRAHAVQTYLSFALDKAVIYNNRSCRFDPGRGIRSVIDRHNSAFVWSHAEFDANDLLPWIIKQVVSAYKDLASLVSPAQASLISQSIKPPVIISQGSASSLPHISDASIDNITVDPPYYDNVQYAELSDFFYVWLKRSVGHLYLKFFRDELTNKDDEAVANPARFVSIGKKKIELAEQDYENKMTAAFREMYRVLRPEGSLTVMFTHKKVEAWETLASALINAGFVIKASWPVHTEFEHSLHQAKKNAAASTILLVCRERDDGRLTVDGLRSAVDGSSSGEATWWDDLAPRVREAARQKAEEFSAQGISGVDLYISTFGPPSASSPSIGPSSPAKSIPKLVSPNPCAPKPPSTSPAKKLSACANKACSQVAMSALIPSPIGTSWHGTPSTPKNSPTMRDANSPSPSVWSWTASS
jgi:putative DNA methylase